jgi:hypothetical protein
VITPDAAHDGMGARVFAAPGHWSADDLARHAEGAVRSCMPAK